MQLSVKTLTGKVFPIEADPSITVAQVKAIIETANSEFDASKLKLIHSGKVLKDEQTLTECGIKEKDFLVVMVVKPKKTATVAAPPVGGAAEPTASSSSSSAPVAAPANAAAAPPSTPVAAAPATTPEAPVRAAAPAVSDADVAALRDMGFPDAEARAALDAAIRLGGGNNPQGLAVEFLMNGIPNIPQGMPQGMPAPVAAPAPGAPGAALAELRNHPQFNQLRQLVQENPAALEPVLQQIGTQSPQLLEAIRGNTAEFLQMLNEPIAPGAAPAPGGAPPAGFPGMPGMPPGGMPGMGAGGPTPQQMAAMFAQMPEQERTRLAGQFNMSPAQFTQLTQMMGQMSPDQLQQMMGMAGGEGGQGGQGIPPGANVIQLTAEEAAAVQRLQQLGFSQGEAAEAYLACDKNEELAANFLFDSMGGGGGGFGEFEDFPAQGGPNDGNDGDGAPPGGAPAPEGGEDDDDMYN